MCIWQEFFFFFFSSRRRHTRFDCDWSSDVCSSDLDALQARGLPAQPLALMAIGPCRDAATQQALQAARNALREGPGYRAVMFVSGNAVQHFFGTEIGRASCRERV